MQTNLEMLGGLQRRAHMSVPVDQIEAEINKRLSKLARTAKVPGFRPGKVPLKMVAQQYGTQVRSDVISDAVKANFADAIREQNLRIAGNPRIEPRTGAGAPDALEFSAVFEIYPEVKVADLSDVTIERAQAEVASEDIERTISMLRRQRTRYEPTEDAAADGDRVTVDFTGKTDGVEFPGGQARDFAIVLGEGRMLPEFEAALAGMKNNETKTFELTFPADYHGKEMAGKKAEFELHAKQVEKGFAPAVDEEFARAFGIASGSVDELRSEIESNLRLELKRKIETRVKDQVFAALRQKAMFVVPKSLVEAEMQNMMERMVAEMREQGVKTEDVNLDPETLRTGAEGRVALGLILSEIVRTENLGAKPEQVKALVQEAAQTYEQPEAVVRWHYEKPERLKDFEALAVEHNVVDWVLSRARVAEQPAAFGELMGTRA